MGDHDPEKPLQSPLRRAAGAYHDRKYVGQYRALPAKHRLLLLAVLVGIPGLVIWLLEKFR